MSKMLWKSLLFSPAVLGATLVFGASAIATETKSAAEVALPQTATSQNSETLLGANALQPEDIQNTASVAWAAEDLATVFSTEETTTQKSGLEAKAQQSKAANQLSGNRLSKTIDEKAATSAKVSVTTKENTIAQAAPANPGNQNTIDEIMRYSREGGRTASGQVTSVSQLRDVQPTDWAFQALQSLVERYGCIEGYPDRTYRGNRALTRYEFAAGLNKCLDRIQELIAALPQGVTKEDLAALQRLQEEFAAELATLRGRVDALDTRVTKLEAQQFSTTTKLKGEAIFALAGVWGGKNWGIRDNNNIVFQDRVRLEFQTSFSGKDLLHTRLAAGNAQAFVNFPSTATPATLIGTSAFGTPRTVRTSEGTLQSFVGGTGGNGVALDWLAYETTFLGGSKLYIAATGGIHSDYLDVVNPYFYDGDGGNGSISAFSQESPIYRIGGGSGAAISFGLGGIGSFLKGSSITGGYLAGGSNGTPGGNSPGSANSPLLKNGLFDGNYAALGQLNLNFCDTFGLALTYVHGYHTTGTDIFNAGAGFSGNGNGIVGTSVANLPTALLFGQSAKPIVTNSYGFSAAFRPSKYFSISGWGMFTDAILLGKGTGEIWSYGLGLSFPNLGKAGNVLGLFAGAEPYLGSLNTATAHYNFGRNTPWHLEGFYKFQLTDNISLTPGVIWLMSPEQNNNNDDIFIGTLRTTFTF